MVDTNILAYRLLPGEKNEAARELVRLDPAWAAPTLWRSEFRNVLSGLLRHGTLTSDIATEIARRGFQCLLAGEHLVGDKAVFDLVAQSKCTAYDCEFVALADVLKVPLVTEDKALLRAFPETCRSLSDCLKNGLRR